MMRTTRLMPLVAGVWLAGLTVMGHAQQMDKPAMEKPMMAAANDFKPFTAEAFKAAKASGRPTLVFFHAPWCPVCRAQEPKLKARLSGDYRHVAPFIVDYDSNLALRKEMGVQKQSTVILFQGEKEVARLSYTSEDAAIDDLFAHAKMTEMRK